MTPRLKSIYKRPSSCKLGVKKSLKMDQKRKQMRPNARVLYEIEGEPRQLTDQESVDLRPLAVRKFGPNHIEVVNRGTSMVWFKTPIARLENFLNVRVVKELSIHQKKEIITKAVDQMFEGVEELEDQNCQFEIEWRPIGKEKACEAKMLGALAKYDAIGRKIYTSHTLPSKDRFCMRIAQDIPGCGASKQYMYAYCSTTHKRGDTCNGDGVMEQIIPENRNLYEIVRDVPRRHYFDIEWVDDNPEDESKATIILNMFAEFLNKPDLGPIYVTKGSRPITPNEDGSYKHSFHVVYRNVYFKNKEQHSNKMDDFREYVANHPLASQVAINSSYKKISKRICNYVYDRHVYSTNRLMRLPNQTKPNGTVPLTTYSIPGFHCLRDPIFINVFGVRNFVAPSEFKQGRTDEFRGLAPKHVEFLALQEKEKRNFFEEHEPEIAINPSKVRTWKDVPAKVLRLYGFGYYLKYLSAVVDIISPKKVEVINWMDRSESAKSEYDYQYVCKMLETSNYEAAHVKTLSNYGLSVNRETKVNKLLSEMFTESTKVLDFLPGSKEIRKMPEFVTTETMSNDNDPSVVEIYTGKMGSGKTESIIRRLANLEGGKRALYIVGRKKLAEEITKKLQRWERIDAYRGPTSWRDCNNPNTEKVLVEVAVINSLEKFKVSDYIDVVVIDESETTLGNYEMSEVNPEDLSNSLYKFITHPNTKVIVADAMFTLPGLMFYRMLFTYGKKVVCIDDDEYNQSLEKDRPPELAKKTITFMELVRKESQNSQKEIIMLFNDFRRVKYFQDNLTTESEEDFEYFGNNGFVMRLLFNVLEMKEKVAVAVPTKQWGHIVQKLFRDTDVKVVRVDGESKMYDQSELEDVDVFVYTSAISAGHSIDIENHFDSIFLIVAKIGVDGKWHTPSVDEAIQMCHRVRQTTSDRLYVAIDSTHHMQKNLERSRTYFDRQKYAVSGNIPMDLMLSGKKLINDGITELNSKEYELFVSKWLTNIAFPGSKTAKPDQIPADTIYRLANDRKSVFEETQDDYILAKLSKVIKDPDTFIGMRSHGKYVSFYAKPVPEEAFDADHNYLRKRVGDKWVICGLK